MKTIHRNKHLWGWAASYLFAWIQLGDSLVRIFSFGLLGTTWVPTFVQKEGVKVLTKRARGK